MQLLNLVEIFFLNINTTADIYTHMKITVVVHTLLWYVKGNSKSLVFEHV